VVVWRCVSRRVDDRDPHKRGLSSPR
jgi:hypothetical protein